MMKKYLAMAAGLVFMLACQHGKAAQKKDAGVLPVANKGAAASGKEIFVRGGDIWIAKSPVKVFSANGEVDSEIQYSASGRYAALYNKTGELGEISEGSLEEEAPQDNCDNAAAEGVPLHSIIVVDLAKNKVVREIPPLGGTCSGNWEGDLFRFVNRTSYDTLGEYQYDPRTNQIRTIRGDDY